MATLTIRTDGTAAGTFVAIDDRRIDNAELAGLKVEAGYYDGELWRTVGIELGRDDFEAPTELAKAAE